MSRFSGLRRRTAFAGALAIALMALVIALAPVTTVANDMLNRFRVQQFETITIPMDMIEQFKAGEHNIDSQISAVVLAQLMAMGDFETNLGHDSLREAGSLDEANRHLGGALAVPSNLPAGFDGAEPRIFVGDAGSASYTFDVARARMMMMLLGLDATSLPDPADSPTVTIALDVPASAGLFYDVNGVKLAVGQMESPVLTIPETVDVEALRETLLSFPGLPEDLVAQIRAVDNWQETLIIPVPSDATTSQRTINGAPGLLIESEQGTAALWQRDGILFGVAGELSVEDILGVADSMD